MWHAHCDGILAVPLLITGQLHVLYLPRPISGIDAPVCSFVVILERFDTSTTVDEFLLSAAAKPRKMASFAIEMYSGLRSCKC
jgi:hypothetical protein